MDQHGGRREGRATRAAIGAKPGTRKLVRKASAVTLLRARVDEAARRPEGTDVSSAREEINDSAALGAFASTIEDLEHRLHDAKMKLCAGADGLQQQNKVVEALSERLTDELRRTTAAEARAEEAEARAKAAEARATLAVIARAGHDSAARAADQADVAHADEPRPDRNVVAELETRMVAELNGNVVAEPDAKVAELEARVVAAEARVVELEARVVAATAATDAAVLARDAATDTADVLSRRVASLEQEVSTASERQEQKQSEYSEEVLRPRRQLNAAEAAGVQGAGYRRQLNAAEAVEVQGAGYRRQLNEAEAALASREASSERGAGCRVQASSERGTGCRVQASSEQASSEASRLAMEEADRSVSKPVEAKGVWQSKPIEAKGVWDDDALAGTGYRDDDALAGPSSGDAALHPAPCTLAGASSGDAAGAASSHSDETVDTHDAPVLLRLVGNNVGGNAGGNVGGNVCGESLEISHQLSKAQMQVESLRVENAALKGQVEHLNVLLCSGPTLSSGGGVQGTGLRSGGGPCGGVAVSTPLKLPMLIPKQHG